jgi:hypothetical protein
MTEQKFPTYLNDCFMYTAEYGGSINTTTACMYISILLTVILDEILARSRQRVWRVRNPKKNIRRRFLETAFEKNWGIQDPSDIHCSAFEILILWMREEKN